jgi:hypothetical protein
MLWFNSNLFPAQNASFRCAVDLRFHLYIKPSNRINLVILNPKSKLRETLSICAKYKTIKSLRSTMRQVNDAPSKQRNSAKIKYMNNLWSHGAWVSTNFNASQSSIILRSLSHRGLGLNSKNIYVSSLPDISQF